MNSRRILVTGALAATLVLAAFRARADTVVLIPNSSVKVAGGQVRGTIQSESPTEVKIGAQSIPVDQIASVSYDGTTPNFTLAETKENNGAMLEAADYYKKAVGEAAGKPFVATAATYGRAHALAEVAMSSTGRATEAIAELEAFIKAHPSSRQLGSALESLASLCIQKGDLPRADGALSELATKVPWAADRAAILKARLLGKQNKHDQALAELDKIIAAAPAKSPKSFEAKLAKAESLAGTKKFDEAEKIVQAVIKEIPAEEAPAQALAHNTLGDCYRAAGRPKDALQEYLKTDILFDKDKDEHQKALAQIAQLWRELKRDDRADEAMERLKQLYPASPWLSQRGGAK
jgi:tetratricopeptide (TPR) repeat protein